MGFYQAVAAGL